MNLVVLKVLTNYLQVFSLAKNFDIKWPPIIVTMFSAAETASGPSIQFYSTQCAIGCNYYERLLVYFLMPIGYVLITIIGLVLVNFINICLMKRKRKSVMSENLQEFDRNNITGTAFISKVKNLHKGLFLMYPTIIKNLLQIINCTEIDGKYYLTKDFNIQC